MKILNFILNVLGLLLILSLSKVSAQQIKVLKVDELTSYILRSERPLVVNFWASWCLPCIEEMPVFQKLLQDTNEKVELVLVSLDNHQFYKSKLNSFLTDKAWNGTKFWLDETNADYFCPKIDSSWSGAIPATLFLNSKTNYRRFLEKQLDSSELSKELAPLLR